MSKSNSCKVKKLFSVNFKAKIICRYMNKMCRMLKIMKSKCKNPYSLLFTILSACQLTLTLTFEIVHSKIITI